ncbi:MAG: hypothetical protein AAF927_02320 [Bacteroidota bacterium]
MRFVILAIALVSAMPSYAQDLSAFKPENQKSLGLAAYLTSVRASAQGKMIFLTKQYQSNFVKDTMTPGDVIASAPATAQLKKAQEKYLAIKVNVDILINQLAVDMYAKNNLRAYKKLDQCIKGKGDLPDQLKPYEKVIEAIDTNVEELMEIKFEGNLPNPTFFKEGGPELAALDLLGIAELGYTILNEEAKRRTQKVTSVLGVLEKVRLKDTTELLAKPKEKEQEEKDDK